MFSTLRQRVLTASRADISKIIPKPLFYRQIERSSGSSMATNIKPLHDRVIVKRIEEGEQVRGGIIIPDTAKEKPQEGEVIAVGEGKRKDDGTRQTLDVQVGDRVLFGKYSGSEIKIDGEEFLIMREDEILGVIERAGAHAGGKKGGK